VYEKIDTEDHGWNMTRQKQAVCMKAVASSSILP